MNKSIIALVFVVGTLLAQCGTTEQSEYQDCIKRNAEIITKAKISDELKTMVEKAREYYNKEAPKDSESDSAPEACKQIEEQLEKISICQKDGKRQNPDKAFSDVFKVSPAAKSVVEAHYTCQWGLQAGAEMKTDGLFDLFAN